MLDRSRRSDFGLGGALFAALIALGACAPMEARPTGAPPGGPNDPVPAAYLRGTDFDKPTMMHYSWGLLDSPPGPEAGPQVQYFWPEIRRTLAARTN